MVHGESLELLIEVTDPEGMPVTVSIMDGSPAEALVQNNILFWNVTTNKTTQFFFKATDACQASATLNISVTVNVCPCNNNGRCIPRTPRGRGFYDCSCSPGFTGQYCSTEIDECESYPCLRGKRQEINFYVSHFIHQCCFVTVSYMECYLLVVVVFLLVYSAFFSFVFIIIFCSPAIIMIKLIATFLTRCWKVKGDRNKCLTYV